MKEMHAWETRCLLREGQCVSGQLAFDEAEKIGMDEYRQIFKAYCSTTKAVPRDFHYTEPPDYNAEGQTIISIRDLSPTLVEIQTQQNYSHRKRHAYRLAIEEGEWKLVERFILLSTGEMLETDL
jgi:hypothetical protein